MFVVILLYSFTVSHCKNCILKTNIHYSINNKSLDKNLLKNYLPTRYFLAKQYINRLNKINFYLITRSTKNNCVVIPKEVVSIILNFLKYWDYRIIYKTNDFCLEKKSLLNLKRELLQFNVRCRHNILIPALLINSVDITSKVQYKKCCNFLNKYLSLVRNSKQSNQQYLMELYITLFSIMTDYDLKNIFNFENIEILNNNIIMYALGFCSRNEKLKKLQNEKIKKNIYFINGKFAGNNIINKLDLKYIF